MAELYGELLAAAENMDCDRMESAFSEMEAYTIPQEERELFDKIKEAGDSFDYDRMIELLKQ